MKTYVYVVKNTYFSISTLTESDTRFGISSFATIHGTEEIAFLYIIRIHLCSSIQFDCISFNFALL